MKGMDKGVNYLVKEVGRILHIVQADFAPGKVSFSFSTCSQIRYTLMDTV